MSIKTYEEFDKKRDKFRTLEIDDDVKAHLSKLFGRGEKFTGVIIETKWDEDSGSD